MAIDEKELDFDYESLGPMPYKEFIIDNDHKEESGSFSAMYIRKADGKCEGGEVLHLTYVEEDEKNPKGRHKNQIDLSLDVTEIELLIEFLQEQKKLIEEEDACQHGGGSEACNTCEVNRLYYERRGKE